MSNEKKKGKKKGVKKSNVDEFITHRHFCLKMKHNFSLYFGEKTFWWVWGENIWVSPFIFLHSHPTKHTQKSFNSHFLFKVFHPPYFTSKQTHLN